MENEAQLLQQYGNTIAVNTLNFTKAQIENYADEHGINGDISLFGVLDIIDKQIANIRKGGTLEERDK